MSYFLMCLNLTNRSTDIDCTIVSNVQSYSSRRIVLQKCYFLFSFDEGCIISITKRTPQYIGETTRLINE